MTENNIQGGFRGSGLVPLDPESVISKLDIKPRTLTPIEEVPEMLAPWVSKTPSNPIEASSQSELIKTRISRHQSSSPRPILDAFDQFAKGTRGIMHQIALLRSENQILRQENDILSKRRTKKLVSDKEGA
jgi:hypothetical protein